MPTKKTKETQPVVVATVVPAVPTPSVPSKTEADKIWDEIKDKPILMFALPNQFVYQHCAPISIEPNRLFVTMKSTATLPSLETAIGDKYTVELADKFVIVARAK